MRDRETWDLRVFMPTHCNAGGSQRQPDNFEEIFQVKAELGKHLMEKCLLEHY